MKMGPMLASLSSFLIVSPPNAGAGEDSSGLCHPDLVVTKLLIDARCPATN
jgi:hypothetical protein